FRSLKTMSLLSGDQIGLDAPWGIKVSCCASPPSLGMSHICPLPLPCFFCSLASLLVSSPSRSVTNASHRPSGDQHGLCALAVPPVKRVAAPPSVGATQIEERYSCLPSSMVVTTKATRRPSGEMRGLLRNRIA